MNLCVVLLNRGSSHTSEIFSGPAHFEIACDSIHEALISLNHLERTGDTELGQQGGTGATGSHVRIGEPFPMRQFSGPGHPQGVESCSADSDCVRGLGRVEPKDLGESCSYTISALHRVV